MTICAKRSISSPRRSPAFRIVWIQTRVLDRVNKTATEARSAAFAAQKQTDPEHYGEIVGATIDGKIGDTLTRVGQMAGDLLRASNPPRKFSGKLRMPSQTPCANFGNGNRSWIVSKVVFHG